MSVKPNTNRIQAAANMPFFFLIGWEVLAHFVDRQPRAFLKWHLLGAG